MSSPLTKAIRQQIMVEEYTRRIHAKYVLMDIETFDRLTAEVDERGYSIGITKAFEISGKRIVRSEDIKGWEVVF